MFCSWHSIMQCFDPIAFTVGSFQIYWYAVCFLLAWIGALLGILYLERKNAGAELLSTSDWQDLFWWLLFGAFVGGRLGFALFYEPLFFWQHPATLFLPYDFSTETLIPLRGMSFHGGLIGVAVTVILWSHWYKISLLSLTDRLVLVAPIISLFGRLGNFLNQELPGRITDNSWGIYFPSDQVLRHPVTLYSLFFEGIFLLFWLGFWRKRDLKLGTLTVIYLTSYSAVRFILEYWREPDPGVAILWNIFTRGQTLSLIMFFGAVSIWFWSSKYAMIKNN